jgi:5-methylcytosine-specific restriction protein A
MPYRTKKQCARPGCFRSVKAGQRYCNIHRRANTYTQKMYNYKWHKARTNYLIDHPLCILCQKEGFIVSATVVDHIRPHKGNLNLFWDEKNWQPLCQTCHNKKTMKENKNE